MEKLGDLKGHTSRVLSMCMSPDGTTVLSAAADETLRFWNFLIIKLRRELKRKSHLNF